MRFDFLREPISEAEPCGPDLEEAGDSGYATYLLLATSRLPQRFFQGAEGGGDKAGLPFDKSSVDLAAEVAAITGFLARTRDIRLLTLEARFQILAGSIGGFSEALQGLALLVTGFWDHFHPLPFDGEDHIMRMNSIEGLVDYAQIILPLQHAPLVSGDRVLPVTYRNFLVASGAAELRERESAIALDLINDALSAQRALDAGRTEEAEKRREQVALTYEAVQAAQSALGDIRQAFVTHIGEAQSPRFDDLLAVMRGIASLIARNRSGLASGAVEADQPGDDGAEGEAQAGLAHMPRAAQIPDQASALRALRAAEAYFLRREASSPALILVHQARMLIGRPLVEALEALMPDNSGRARLKFDAGFPFEIDLSRMKLVTEDALAMPAAEDEPAAEAGEAGPEPVPFRAATRLEAADLLLGIEAFYRAAEPSSPIPVLLVRARSYLNKDFSTILGELLPKDE